MFAKRIEQKIFRDVAPQTIRHVAAAGQHEATGLVKDVYRQMAKDFQVVPPLMLHSPVPRLLAAVWGIVRESMVAGPVSRVNREAVAAAVSKINECPFCVDVHTTMLHGGKEHTLARQLLDGDLERVPLSPTRDIVEWALATRSPEAPIIASPPFTSDEAPEIIGTAVAFHYINRMVNIFLEESPIVLPSFLKWLKKPVGHLAGSLIGERVMGLTVESGKSLTFLADAELPAEFSWANGNEPVAAAFARFSLVMGKAGQSCLPDRVRDLVIEHVESWNGDDPGMNRSWVEDAVADLPDVEKASGQLALLAALASYQVDDGVIEQFRKHYPSDRELISTAGWASYVATRKVSSWLGSPSSGGQRLPNLGKNLPVPSM